MNYSCLFSPKKLRVNKVPSKLDILRAFIFEKEKWLEDNDTIKEPENSLIADILTEKIQRVHCIAAVKNLRKDKIKDRIIKISNSRMNLLKIPRTKRYSEMFTKQQEKFLSILAGPFIVTDNNTSKKSARCVFKKCLHKKDASNEFKITNKRSASVLSRQKSYAIITNEEYESITEGEDGNDSDFKLPSTTNKRKGLPEIIEAQTRFGTSVRATSAIVNATLREFDIPTVIDKSKLIRAQKRKFKEVDNYPVVLGGALYYDSRKDRTIIPTRKRDENGKMKIYRNIRREEHYSLVSEPPGIFLGFVAVENGTAAAGSEAIINFLEEKRILDDLQALGSDGANTNVGSEGGINRYIESELNRPLHWFICMLHANELPLKALITKLDGDTSSSKSYSGPIGKQLADVDDTQIVHFKKFYDAEPLEEIPDHVYKKLSNDQKYLYNIVNALISGDFPRSLCQLKIGPLNHSRWITTASRCCKLYASTKKPSKTLYTITSYIVNVYAPTWFRIKRNERAIHGPKNLFFLIQKSNLIADIEARSIVQKCIERNSFFAHSENVLLAQLSSETKPDRIDAVNKILRIRNKKSNGRLRFFETPKINFKAKSWIDMAAIKPTNQLEPPLTLNMNDVELMAIIDQPLQVPKFRCHTQMVERAVKEVTKVSKTVIDHDKRNSMVKVTLINRFKYPKLNSKKDFSINKPFCFVPKI